jgi:APA family basic amino acid/polyamine antiporter
LTTEPLAVPKPAPASGRLLKVLGMWFGMAAAIGNTISAGIVRTPGDVAKLLPNAWMFLGVWVLGGLYALSGASSMAELGAAIPRSGGQYNFSRRALGDYAGFIVGWSDWLSTCGTAAAVAIVIAEYSGHLFPILTGTRKIEIISVVIIFGFGVLQWRGIKWGSGAQLSTAAMKTGAFLVLVIACFLLCGPAHKVAVQSGPSNLPLPTGWPLAIAIMLGLQAVIYTVDGWDGIIYFGEEVREPGRDIPRAIFGSVFSIMGIYLLLNLVALYVLPMKDLAGNDFVLGSVADLVFGKLGDPIIRSIMLISMLSCMSMPAEHRQCRFSSAPSSECFSCSSHFSASARSSASSPCSPSFLSRIIRFPTFLSSDLERKSRRWHARIARGAIRGQLESRLQLRCSS